MTYMDPGSFETMFGVMGTAEHADLQLQEIVSSLDLLTRLLHKNFPAGPESRIDFSSPFH